VPRVNFEGVGEAWNALRAGVSSLSIAAGSLLRGLSLLVAGRPRTPLRALCIMAFDLLHTLDHAEPLARDRIRALAALLDFGACANAAFDNKGCCPHEYQSTRQLLEEAGIGWSVADYVRRLAQIEASRPAPGGDYGRFREVVLYREAVVRLSLGMVAATADGRLELDEAIRATGCDWGLEILFRIVMLCQIIDDVLDYSQDLSAGLPSFLTAVEPLPQAFEATRVAAREYADRRDLPQTAALLPLRLALCLVSISAQLVIVVRRRAYSVRACDDNIVQSLEAGYSSPVCDSLIEAGRESDAFLQNAFPRFESRQISRREFCAARGGAQEVSANSERECRFAAQSRCPQGG